MRSESGRYANRAVTVVKFHRDVSALREFSQHVAGKALVELHETSYFRIAHTTAGPLPQLVLLEQSPLALNRTGIVGGSNS